MGQDNFDAVFADHKHSSSSYEEINGTHRTWPELSAEGKLRYLVRDAVWAGVPFERFAAAARDFLGDVPAAGREEAALRLVLHQARELHGVERLMPPDRE